MKPVCLKVLDSIFDRGFDAYDDDRYEPGGALGHGATREEAVNDLFEQLEEYA